MEKNLEKDASRVPHWEALLMALFLQLKQKACKRPQTPDLGAFVRAQIVAQEAEPNPIGFTPDGAKGRAWLASDNDGSKIIGDDRLWRVNTEELLRQRERRPKTIS